MGSKIEAKLAELRREYMRHTLNEDDVAAEPFAQFDTWFHETVNAQIFQADAMILATVTAESTPDVRTVLLKSANADGFIFFTNYSSAKGRQLTLNDSATLLFFWPELERQVRIKGTVSKTSDEVSDAYFATRPTGAQLASSISPQSEVIEGRPWLEQALREVTEKHPGGQVKRPPHWGGFVLKPYEFEFWQGRENRLHDRIRYRWTESGWKIARLAP